jgi:hypothetical protein
MKILSLITYIALAALIVSACSAPVQKKTEGEEYRKPGAYNFRFVGYDADIKNPDNDRRSYYKIFIDKAEEGRTTTGLESQEKTFEIALPPNRHLITIEKWVLDEKTARYIKLNNIEQPKPNFFYFSLPADKVVIVEMRSGTEGTTEYRAVYERN